MNLKEHVYIDNIQSEDQISESSQDYMINSKAEELQQAFNNLQKFLTQVQSDKDESLQKQIIDYSKKQIALSKSSQDILKLCQKRIQKMLRNKKTKKNWNQDDIDILVWVLNQYGAYHIKKSVHSFDQADWKFVSSLIPATTWKKCMFKWLSLKKFSLLTFRWSARQSEILSNLIKQNGKKNWKKLAEKLYVANNSPQKVFRTPKQCRQHWNCYLNPSIKKGPWSIKEDIKLLENVLELNCMKKWSQVAKSIKGRTQNAVKNRFSLLLDKQRKQTGEQNEKNLINRILVKLMHQESLQLVSIKSDEIKDIQIPNQIFEQSDGSNNNLIEQKSNYVIQKKTQGVQQNEKVEQKSKSKIIIPTIIQNQQFFPQAQFYQINPGLTPYFFGMMYGGHYNIG